MASQLAYRARNAVRRSGFEIVRYNTSGNLLSMHLSHLFARYQINCVLDVGARQGEFGGWLRGAGYKGRIISFEPVSSNLGQLRARAAADPAWDVQTYALGATNTTATINVTNSTAFSSFRHLGALAGELFPRGSAVTGTEDVPVRRLADVWDEVIRPDTGRHVYLKCDTQGWDLEVLRGAEPVLSHVVALQSEMAVQRLYEGMPTYEEALRVINGYGYTLSGMFPVNLDHGLRLLEFDGVAIRSDLVTS
jgi:FkbM family methyltransferase